MSEEIVVPLRRPQAIDVLTVGELEALGDPQQWAGEGFLGPGFRVMLAGAPKLGKSHLAVQLLMACAAGGEFLNMKFHTPRRVLYVNAEIKAEYIKDRIIRAMSRFSDREQRHIRANFLLTGRSDINLETMHRTLREVCREHKPYVICIDPLSQFFTGGDSNSSDSEADRFKTFIDPICSRDWVEDHEMSVVVVHHTAKNNSRNRNDFDTIRGTGFYRSWFDTGMLLAPGKVRGLVQLNFELRNGVDPEPVTLELNRDSLSFDAITIDEDMSPTMLNVVQMMSPDWHSTAEMKALMAQTTTWRSEFGASDVESAWRKSASKYLSGASLSDYGLKKRGEKNGTEYRIV